MMKIKTITKNEKSHGLKRIQEWTRDRTCLWTLRDNPVLDADPPPGFLFLVQTFTVNKRARRQLSLCSRVHLKGERERGLLAVHS